MKRKLLVFDLDGTLMDTLDGITHAADKALIDRGLPALGRPFYETAIGGGARPLIEKALKEAGGGKELMEGTLSDFLAGYKESWSVGLRCYPGMEELVLDLKNRGYTILVNTNKPDQIALPVVRSVFPEEVISGVAGSSPNYPKKPDPAGLDLLLAQCGGTRVEAIYIGDSRSDVMTARNAGIPVIAVTWGYADRASIMNADALVESVDDLKKAILEN
jgi:phosphoglycolate phosphatase